MQLLVWIYHQTSLFAVICCSQHSYWFLVLSSLCLFIIWLCILNRKLGLNLNLVSRRFACNRDFSSGLLQCFILHCLSVCILLLKMRLQNNLVFINFSLGFSFKLESRWMIISASFNLVEDKTHAHDISLLLSWSWASIVSRFSFKVAWILEFNDCWRPRGCLLFNHFSWWVLLNINMHFWNFLVELVMWLDRMYLRQAACLENWLHFILGHLFRIVRRCIHVEVIDWFFFGNYQMIYDFYLWFTLRLMILNFYFGLFCEWCLIGRMQLHPFILTLHKLCLSFNLELCNIRGWNWCLCVIKSELRLAHVGIPNTALGLIFNLEGRWTMAVTESS